jgi:hypothetical protein
VEIKYDSMWGWWASNAVIGSLGVGVWKYIRRRWGEFSRFIRLGEMLNVQLLSTTLTQPPLTMGWGPHTWAPPHCEWGLCQSCDGVVPQSCPLDWRWVMVLRSNLARCVVWRLDFEGSFSRIV